MELQGYTQYKSSAPHQITTQDKFVYTKGGNEQAVTILLARRSGLVCRVDGEKAKRDVFVTEWAQEDGIPMLYEGGELELWVRIDTPVATDKPVVKRVKPAPGESKIAKCRAIYSAHPTASKEEVIAKFISEAGCTPQGAVTYYITCRKG